VLTYNFVEVPFQKIGHRIAARKTLADLAAQYNPTQGRRL
jgi:hypothetical protein